jgi:hypothetical protein
MDDRKEQDAYAEIKAKSNQRETVHLQVLRKLFRKANDLTPEELFLTGQVFSTDSWKLNLDQF